MNKILLRPYQEKAKEDIKNFIEKSSNNKGLVVLPTGAGKALIVGLIAEMCKKNVLVIQPSKELLEQNYEKAKLFGVHGSIYSASMGTKEVSNITFATPMSIVNNRELFKDFEYVVVDECHIGFSNEITGNKVSRKGVICDFLDRLKPKKVIGLTATPIQLVSTMKGSEIRMVNRSMRSYWYRAEMIHVTQISDISKDYWATLKIESCPPEKSVLTLNSTGVDFTEASILNQYNTSNIKSKILQAYETLSKKGNKHFLIFVPTIETAEELERKHKDFKAVSANTPMKERNEIIRDFKAGKIKAVVNVSCIATGFDFPELDTIILGRETSSFGLYYQMLGRVVRPLMKNGKVMPKIGTVIDFTNNSNRFGDINTTTFENNDYTNGWAMWNNDSLLTGYPLGDWSMPSRALLTNKFDKKELAKEIKSSTAEGNLSLWFGKHKGKTLEYLWENERGYCMWMLEKLDYTKNSVRPIIKYLSERNLEKVVDYDNEK